MYAIYNVKTKQFVYGTDYRYYPRHQRTSLDQMLTYEDLRWAQIEFRDRGCGKDYRIVILRPVEIERILESTADPV